MMPSSLPDILESFNRKERNLLVRDILGPDRLGLGKQFRTRVGDAGGPTIGENAWWATDYHFDWIFAAVMLATGKAAPNVAQLDDDSSPMTATQEDIDLIVADQDQLILIEVKAHGAWDQKQFDRKRERFERLRQVAGGRFSVYLLLMSPRPPQRLSYPATFKLVWLPLVFDTTQVGYRVARCDGQGTIDRDGKHWKIVEKAPSDPVTPEEL